MADGITNLRVAFTDAQYEKLKEVKGKRKWRLAILEAFGVGDQPTPR